MPLPNLQQTAPNRKSTIHKNANIPFNAQQHPDHIRFQAREYPKFYFQKQPKSCHHQDSMTHLGLLTPSLILCSLNQAASEVYYIKTTSKLTFALCGNVYPSLNLLLTRDTISTPTPHWSSSLEHATSAKSI